MGTTTKNLGLYKPAANDYYNVETDQNENFDKIDEKFGEVDNGLKTKLDKGSYEGDANDLKREVDNKVSKAGDTMTGALILNGPNANQLTIQVNGKNVGQVIAGVDNAIGIYNITNAHYMKLNGDGTTIIHANNLHTISKEVISAINELKISTDGKEAAITKKTGFNLDKSDSVLSSDTNTLATSLAVKKANDNANTRALKSGDSFTGTITVTGLSDGDKNIYFDNINGRGAIYCGGNDGNGISFINYASNKKLMLKDDGGLILHANNLQTPNKELVSAVNYVFDFAKNLVKTKVVRVDKDYFKTITTRPVIDERHLVEATFDTGIQNIIAVTPVNAYGYMEYVALFESGSTKIVCGQAIDSKFYTKEQGYMDILITYINI